MRRSQKAVTKKVVELRARSCMLGLSECEQSWSVAGWILRVIQQVMGDKSLFNPESSVNHSMTLADSSHPSQSNIAAGETTAQYQAGSQPDMGVDSVPFDYSAGLAGMSNGQVSGNYDGEQGLTLVNNHDFNGSAFMPQGLPRQSDLVPELTPWNFLDLEPDVMSSLSDLNFIINSHL